MAAKPIPQIVNARKELPVDFVRAILDYKPRSGLLIWKKRFDIAPLANSRVGKIAGFMASDGYIYVQINNKWYLAHRLAWVIMKGEWPKNDIDHVRAPKTNNKWSNLREATTQQNTRNTKKRASNTSKFKWVSWDKSKKCWVARIRDGKTHLNLGRYKTPEEGYAVACKAAKKLHGKFANYG
jgi:hypothetical protein